MFKRNKLKNKWDNNIKYIIDTPDDEYICQVCHAQLFYIYFACSIIVMLFVFIIIGMNAKNLVQPTRHRIELAEHELEEVIRMGYPTNGIEIKKAKEKIQEEEERYERGMDEYERTTHIRYFTHQFISLIFIVFIVSIFIQSLVHSNKIATLAYQKGLREKKSVTSAISHDLKSMVATAYDTVCCIDNYKIAKESLIIQLRQLQQALNDFSEFNKLDRPDMVSIIRNDMNIIDINEYLFDYYLALQYANELGGTMEFEEQILEEPTYICVSCDSISRIMRNIISNAKKYSDGTTITIKTWVNKKELHINIGDNGKGLPADLKDCLFEPYKCGNSARTISDTGEYHSGIGMYIVKKLVELNDGFVTYESTEKGLWFDIVFPIIVRKEALDD